MYSVLIETHFSSAHCLREYDGPCEALHGHNWKVTVAVQADVLDELGMVVDFKVLKQEVGKVIDRLDHTYLNDLPPFDTVNPSSENIAHYIFHEVKKTIDDERKRVSEVCVWESEGSMATYSE